MDIEQKFDEIFKKTFKNHNDKFLSNMSANDIEEWDSLNHLNLTMLISKEFNISLEFDEIMNMDTIGDVKKIVNKKINEQNN